MPAGAQLEVLVTGGTRGIGAATARELLAAGHRVTITGRPGRPEEGQSRTELPHGGAAFRALELGDAASVARLAQELEARPPDVLINNAGSALFGRLEQLGAHEIAAAIAVGLTGTAQLSARVVGAWRSAGRGGRVINVGSIVERFGAPHCSVYAACKGALRAFSQNLAAELAGSGISFTHLVLGAVHTRMTDGLFDPAQMLATGDAARALRFLVETPFHVRIDELTVYPERGLLQPLAAGTPAH